MGCRGGATAARPLGPPLVDSPMGTLAHAAQAVEGAFPQPLLPGVALLRSLQAGAAWVRWREEDRRLSPYFPLVQGQVLLHAEGMEIVEWGASVPDPACKWITGVSLLRVFDTVGYGRIQQDTAGYSRIWQDTAGYRRIRQYPAGYGRIRRDTAGYGRIRRIRQDTAGYGRTRQIRQDKAGYGRTRQDTTGSKISACLHYENNHFAFIQRSVVFHTVLACLL